MLANYQLAVAKQMTHARHKLSLGRHDVIDMVPPTKGKITVVP
jgi:hypothetical protein